jgi:hypothetical protein
MGPRSGGPGKERGNVSLRTPYGVETEPASRIPPVRTDDNPVGETGEGTVTAPRTANPVDSTEYVDGDVDCIGGRCSLLGNGRVIRRARAKQKWHSPELRTEKAIDGVGTIVDQP